MNLTEMRQIERQIRDAIDAGNVDEALRLGAILDAEDHATAVRLSSPEALGAAALWYAEQGIPVFPLKPRMKTPATKHGFKDATTNLETIREWWGRMPAANIGTPTGITFDVIDIDGPHGMASLLEFDKPVNQRSYYEEIKALRIGHVITPRDGGHHLYIPPQGQKNAAKVYPGIDYRGRGGYVALPPSVTDEHGPGRMYRWLHVLDIASTKPVATSCDMCGNPLDPVLVDVGRHVNCGPGEVEA